MTISISEELSENSPHFILSLQLVVIFHILLLCKLNWFERVFEILPGIDLIVLVINELQSEISDYPGEGRKILGKEVLILLDSRRLRIHMDVFAKVDNKRKSFEGILIYCVHAVEHKVR